MTTMVNNTTDTPVRKSITVKATPQHAFRVFTEEFDTWWPRSHHIGKGPLEKAVVETRLHGRCYGRSTDGTECDWGTVLVWDPPRRFVLAWQITATWQYEPDLTKSSEVEVCFTPEADGSTRVDLEHRHFDRHGVGAGAIRTSVDSPNGWSGLLQLFATQAGHTNSIERGN